MIHSKCLLVSCIPHPLYSFPLPPSTLFSKSGCGIQKTVSFLIDIIALFDHFSPRHNHSNFHLLQASSSSIHLFKEAYIFQSNMFIIVAGNWLIRFSYKWLFHSLKRRSLSRKKCIQNDEIYRDLTMNLKIISVKIEVEEACGGNNWQDAERIYLGS